MAAHIDSAAVADVAEVFGQVHRQTQSTLADLIEPMRRTLEHFGCRGSPNRARFDFQLVDTLTKIRTAADDAPPLSSFETTTGGDKRRFLVEQIIAGFGAEPDRARAIADTVVAMDPGKLAAARVNSLSSRDVAVRLLATQLTAVFRSAIMLYGRLSRLSASVSAPYRGTTADPGPGIEQVCDLLGQYPDIADVVYAKLGWRDLTGFPPQMEGVRAGPSQTFAIAVRDHLSDEVLSDGIATAGLIAAGIAATVLTGGLGAPWIGVLAGAGLGVAGSAVVVTHQSSALTIARDASLIGAGSNDRVDHAARGLEGAWWGLAITLVGGGLFARLGGATVGSQLVRGTLLGGATGGAVAVANPNTWVAENSVGVVLMGTVVGAGGAALGAAAGIGAQRLVSGAVAQVAVPMRALDRPLAPGDRVKVSYAADRDPLDAAFVRFSGNVVHLELGTGSLQVTLTRAIRIAADAAGEPTLMVRGLSGVRMIPNTKWFRPPGGGGSLPPISVPQRVQSLLYRSTSPLRAGVLRARIRHGPVSMISPRAGPHHSHDTIVFDAPDGQTVLGFRGPDGNPHLLYVTRNQSYVLARADGEPIGDDVDVWMTGLLAGGVGRVGARGSIPPGTARARGAIVHVSPNVGMFLARIQRLFQLQGRAFDDDTLLFSQDTGIVLQGSG